MLNFLISPRCCLCGDKGDLVFSYGLCQSCFRGLPKVGKNFCFKCGCPIDGELQSTYICKGCHQDKPLYDYGISVFRYTDFSKKILFEYKYSRNKSLKSFFGRLLAKKLNQYFDIDSIDYISFIPTDLQRLKKRGFCHAEELGKALALLLKKSCFPLLLRTFNRSKPMYKVALDERKENLSGRLIFNPFSPQLHGKRIFLVDDLFTTGLSFNEATKILIEEGASEVYIGSIFNKRGNK